MNIEELEETIDYYRRILNNNSMTVSCALRTLIKGNICNGSCEYCFITKADNKGVVLSKWK